MRRPRALLAGAHYIPADVPTEHIRGKLGGRYRKQGIVKPGKDAANTPLSPRWMGVTFHRLSELVTGLSRRRWTASGVQRPAPLNWDLPQSAEWQASDRGTDSLVRNRTQYACRPCGLALSGSWRRPGLDGWRRQLASWWRQPPLALRGGSPQLAGWQRTPQLAAWRRTRLRGGRPDVAQRGAFGPSPFTIRPAATCTSPTSRRRGSRASRSRARSGGIAARLGD